MALFAELRRRNVLKVALLYLIASWLVLWFVVNTGEALGMPVWAETFTQVILAIGFPIALVFAWTSMRSRQAAYARRPASIRPSPLFTRQVKN